MGVVIESQDLLGSEFKGSDVPPKHVGREARFHAPEKERYPDTSETYKYEKSVRAFNGELISHYLPMPPSKGYHLVTWELVCRMSESLKGTTPSIGSCSRCRESRTVTVTMPERQSRMNRSVPALKMGLLLTTLVRVR